MKTFYKLSVLLLAAVLVASCSDPAVKPERTKIFGALGEYFKVVDRTYNIKDNKINIEFERIAEGFPAPWEEGMAVGCYENQVEPGFIVEFVDKDGDVIGKETTNIVHDSDELAVLGQIKTGESTSVKFKAPKGCVSFKVSSTFEYNQPKEASISDALDVFNDKEINEAVEDIKDYADAAKSMIEAEKELLNLLK